MAYLDGAACIVVEAERVVGGDNQAGTHLERIWFDPDLGFAPCRWEHEIEGHRVSVRTNTEFMEFAPGCWLPLRSDWIYHASSWTANEYRNRPALTYRMQLLHARMGEVEEKLFQP